MKFFALFIIGSFVSISSFAASNQKMINNAVISCIRVVENADSYSVNEGEVEIFFWSEDQDKEARSLYSQGYKHRTITIYGPCSDYTPIIAVDSRDRDAIMRAINDYQPVIEDGARIKSVDLDFYLF